MLWSWPPTAQLTCTASFIQSKLSGCLLHNCSCWICPAAVVLILYPLQPLSCTGKWYTGQYSAWVWHLWHYWVMWISNCTLLHDLSSRQRDPAWMWRYTAQTSSWAFEASCWNAGHHHSQLRWLWTYRPHTTAGKYYQTTFHSFPTHPLLYLHCLTIPVHLSFCALHSWHHYHSSHASAFHCVWTHSVVILSVTHIFLPLYVSSCVYTLQTSMAQ